MPLRCRTAFPDVIKRKLCSDILADCLGRTLFNKTNSTEVRKRQMKTNNKESPTNTVHYTGWVIKKEVKNRVVKTTKDGAKSLIRKT